MSELFIENIIKEHIPFIHGTTSKGWHKVYCEVCGDGSRTKGPRGGWFFDGSAAFYSCFNCGVQGSFDHKRQYPFSTNMRKIFKSFGIPSSEYNKVAYQFYLSGNNLNKIQKPKSNIEKIEFPDYFYSIKDAPDVMKEEINNFLLKHYGLNINSYNFLISSGKTKSASPKDIAMAKNFLNRIIIPIYKNGSLIYFLGRSYLENNKVKYLNCDKNIKNIIYGFDKLYTDISTPLYITEGFFDAIHLDGVAVLGNKITEEQIEILNSSPRRKIVVQDRFNTHHGLVEAAIKEDWEISFPDFGNCKDVSESIVKYGKLYTVFNIIKHVKDATSSSFLYKISAL